MRSEDYQPVDHQSLAVTVSDAIAALIIGGVFPAGSRLTEIELVNRLGVSRSPVREALQRLSGEGLVRLAPRRGAHVADLNPQDAVDLYECRILLESAACRLAIRRLLSDTIARLDDLIASMEAASKEGDGLAFLDSNAEYHRVLTSSCPNRVLREFVALTWRRSAWYGRLLILIPVGYIEESLAFHQRLHECVKGGDAEGTERVMKELFEFALQQIVAHFPDVGDKSAVATSDVGASSPFE